MRRWSALFIALSMGIAGLGSMRPAGAAEAPSAAKSPIVAETLAKKLDVAGFTDILTVFVRGTDLAAARRAVASAGLAKITEWKSIDTVVATGLAGRVRSVTRQAGLEYVELDKPIHYFLDTSHIATRAEEARTLPQLETGGLPYDGAGITIAINDSGVDGSHEMFVEGGVSKVKNNVRELCSQAVCSGLTINMAKTPVNDSDWANGHGTHVAGIAGGYERTTADGRKVRGAAPGATLVAHGSGVGLSILAANSGLEWAYQNRSNPCLDGSCPPLRVINNSWGATGEFDPNSATTLLTNNLVNAGVVVVYAVGNGDELNDGGDGSDNRVGDQAQNPLPGVIGVANYDDLETGSRNGQLDSSSSRGQRGRPETYPDVAAPGSLIVSACNYTLPICRSYGNTQDVTDPKYASIGGTSMAAPYVAGIVAVMLQANPALTPAQVEDLLEDNAYKFGDPLSYEADLPARNNDNTTSFDKGHGLIDVTATLGEVLNVSVPAGPPPPPPPTTETKPYTGAYGDGLVNCALGLGGACFDINGPKPGARITINDANADWNVAALYQFRDAADVTIGEGFMCGQIQTTVPAGSVQLLLFISEATGPANCFLADGSISPGAATTGTVTVDWIPVTSTNVVTKKYAGGEVANCAGVGGNCFDVQAGATSADVVLADEHADGDVGAFWQFEDAAQNVLTSGDMCGATSQPVPAGATVLRFFMTVATGPLVCTESVGAATTGSITVTWN